MVICSPRKFSLSRLDLPRGRVFGAGSPAFFHICTTGFILAGLHSAPIAPIENMTTQTSREEAKPAAGPGTASAFWSICPRSGYLFISAIRPSTRRPSGSRCEALSSSVGNRRKSVERRRKVVGKNRRCRKVYAQSFLEPLRLSIRN
jgi:hypothetical protein